MKWKININYFGCCLQHHLELNQQIFWYQVFAKKKKKKPSKDLGYKYFPSVSGIAE